MASNPAAPDLLPAAPAYGTRSVADVLSSAAAVLGVPGYENLLSLPAARRVCVVMVDGLGLSLLKKRGGHAPFLKGFLPAARTLSASFPTTTVASLASLGTGLPPGRHGLVGYDVLDPNQDKVVNMLGSWDPGVDPLQWQPYPTILETAAEHIPVATVSLPRFADSALTRAALRGGTFIPASGVHARVSAAVDALAGADRMLMYLYWNELDKAGHRYGAASPEWGNELEELDSALKRLVARVPAGTLVVLTADHGMVDVPASQRFDFSTQPELIDGVRHTAGEPRMVHLYLEPDAGDDALSRLKAAWQAAYGTRAWIFTRDEAVRAGYFGPEVDAAVLPRIGDLMIAARERIALFDTRRVAASALEVTGQHGSLTKAECEVPLLVLAQPETRKRTSSPVQGGK
ncbi:alkaline phosphatase family protein [Arthrobacter sp. zg-Y895]|uniref:alkaline phosphatase family protein n=1 Tax=Arthrobacter sp. zg-Y895 TaxID=2886933 RepID=UPI001D14C348|nr:alkaline phosphatase family protein [Arthrobacter sp. zg-Y895]